MKKLKLVILAALFIGFSSCDSSTSQKEEETTEQTTDSLSSKEEIKEIVRDNRTPNGSYFKAEIGGVEKIFDFAANSVKANHYDYLAEQRSSRTRMVRHTSEEKERISIQIAGLLLDTELPISIPNDSLGVQMKFSYYYKTGKDGNTKRVLKPSNDFVFTITEIKGDSLIGTFEGFLFTDAVANNDFTKVANGTFRFKLEGITPAM